MIKTREGFYISRTICGKKWVYRVERLKNGELGIQTTYGHLTLDEIARGEEIQKQLDERNIKNK